jgi:3-oxoacyl-[acyl-carrier protein] reductase
MSEPRSGAIGPYPLDRRVAVVTGGSGGIGAAVARRLAEAGAVVVIGYNDNRERARSVADSLPGAGHIVLRLPLESSAELLAAAQEVRLRLGRTDILINSAGITRAVPHADLDALDDATFDSILITNVRGTFSATRAFAPLLRESGDGVVVNLSSISAQTGLGSSIAYCASKGALETMSRSLARVLAPQVRVINISPAAVNTGFVPGRDEAAIRKQAASNPLNLVAEPDDIAISVLSAITHMRLMTGSTIVVDGGRHL